MAILNDVQRRAVLNASQILVEEALEWGRYLEECPGQVTRREVLESIARKLEQAGMEDALGYEYQRVGEGWTQEQFEASDCFATVNIYFEICSLLGKLAGKEKEQ